MSNEDIRLLVVDDDPDAAAVLSDLLEMDGYRVRVARDGAQALALAEAFHPDGVLLDLGLPDVDGLEVAKQLRARYGVGLVLVAVTGRSSDEERFAADAAGIDFFIVKPVDTKVLAKVFGRER